MRQDILNYCIELLKLNMAFTLHFECRQEAQMWNYTCKYPIDNT